MIRKLLFISMTCFVLCATGCGEQRVQNSDGDTQKEQVTHDDMKDLKSGRFYILHKGKYTELYANEASFDTAEKGGAGDNRALWYRKDYSAIPTFYKGDSLVYLSSDDLPESFTIDRFFAVGPTIGVWNLKKNASGRYAFNPALDGGDLNVYSDASRLSSIKTESAVIQAIGDTEVNSSFVSRYGGMIHGLKYDSYYSFDVYGGTAINRYTLQADCYGFAYMDSCELTDYTYLRSKLISIEIPSWFNTGYYYFGGENGLFRYVDAYSYDENTEFNIENVKPTTEETKEETDEEIKDVQALETAEKNLKFSLPRTTKVRVLIEYTEAGDDENLPTPSATVTGGNAVYTLNPTASSKLEREIELIEGDYVVTVTNLFGRSCTVKVIDLNASREPLHPSLTAMDGVCVTAAYQAKNN